MPWTRLSRELKYDNPYYKIYLDKVETTNKKLLDYHLISVRPAVMIIAVTAENEIVLIRQFRYPMNDWCLEVPCGNAEGMEPLFGAQKELREETGITAKNWKQLGSYFPYNGLCTEECFLFLATDLEYGETEHEDSEEIDILKVPLEKIPAMIAHNEIKDGQSLAALQLYFAKFPNSAIVA